MTHFSDDILAHIKDRLLVSDIVKRRVALKPKGKDWLGLCPFHNEKTPSFTVNDQKGFYHCFGCGAHGDVFGFLVNHEKRSFPEAVEECAQLAGINLPAPSIQDQQATSERKQLFDILDATAQLYQETLTPTHPGMQYLLRRGIQAAAIKDFRLGYAINGHLRRYLSQTNVPLHLAEKAGIIKSEKDAVKERFWDRLIFPIIDVKQRIIGFGGRTLGEAQPKYLNSPDNNIFHKNETLYGIHRMNLKADHAILVEGYLDVIAMAQVGFSNVFAPMGTSITHAQAEKILKHFKRIYFCFDGDPAGLKAMRRAADIFLPLIQPGIELFFTRLPNKEDPHSIVTDHSAHHLSKKLKEAQTLIPFLIAYESMEFSELTASNKALTRKRILDTIDTITDNYLKSLYKKEVFEHFSTQHRQKHFKSAGPIPTTVSMPQAYENALIKAFIKHPVIINDFLDTLRPENFSQQTQDILVVIEEYIFSSEPLEFSLILPYIKKHLPNWDIDALLNAADLHAPFLSEPADIPRIKAGIAEILDYFNAGVSLDQHIADMQNRFKQSQDPKDWEILSRLLKEKAQRHNSDDRYS